MSKIISIAVLSFNSQDTIIDTLESILSQDYGSHNIELIISDDSSTDNTQSIIKNWILLNEGFFKKLIVNFEKKNKGINANFNKACQLSSSEWFKVIAADDLLYKNCISIFMEYINFVPMATIIFSRCTCFNDSGDLYISPTYYRYNKMSPTLQFYCLLVNCFIYAPGSFIKKELIEKHSINNDYNFIMEDYPLWLNITSNNTKLYFIETPVVKYRVGNGVSSNNKNLINIKLAKDTLKCKKIFLKKVNNIFFRIMLTWDYYLHLLSINIKYFIFKNKRNIITIWLNKILNPRILSPIFLWLKLKKVDYKK